jgi:hypothetical protein
VACSVKVLRATARQALFPLAIERYLCCSSKLLRLAPRRTALLPIWLHHRSNTSRKHSGSAASRRLGYGFHTLPRRASIISCGSFYFIPSGLSPQGNPQPFHEQISPEVHRCSPRKRHDSSEGRFGDSFHRLRLPVVLWRRAAACA